MNEQDKCSCFDCRFFTKAIGEKGYCTLYHHETALPEKACPRFESEEKAETSSSVKPESFDVNSRKISNYLVGGAFFASVILSALAMIIVVVFGVNIINVEVLPLFLKIIFIIIGLCLVLLFSYLLFRLGKKYAWARVLEMVLALVACVVALTYFNSIIFSANNFATNIIEKIVKIL